MIKGFLGNCRDCGFIFTQDFPVEAEIGRYYETPDYISHSDTKKGAMNSVYHRVRSYMLKRKARLVAHEAHRKTGRLLDIGTGTGYFADTMNRAGWQVEYKANGYFKSEHLAKRGYYQEYRLDNGKVLRVRGSRGVTPQSEHKYEQCVNNNAEFHIAYKNMYERFYFFETGKFKSFVIYLSCSYGGNEVEVFDIRNNA